MKAKITAFVLKFYTAERPLLKELTSAFLKAFFVTFIPAVTGLLGEVAKAGGGHVHYGVLVSILASAFLAAVYAGVHAAVKVAKQKIGKKVGATS